jgi:hypothetical protein
MKKIIVGLILSLATALSGCGGGGGGDGADRDDPNAAATVQLISSKTRALADGSDAVTLVAEVTRADGSAVADGTVITFTVPAGSGTLSAALAATNGGVASVNLTRPPIDGAKNQIVTVTGTAGQASGAMEVKFINQPTSVELFIAMDAPVANLGALQLTVQSTAGVTFNNTTAQVFTLNNAAVGASLATAGFNIATNSTTIALVSANGFNSATAPILKATFSVAANAGLPSFSIDSSPSRFTATDPTGLGITPALTAANIVLSATFDTE